MRIKILRANSSGLVVLLRTKLFKYARGRNIPVLLMNYTNFHITRLEYIFVK